MAILDYSTIVIPTRFLCVFDSNILKFTFTMLYATVAYFKLKDQLAS